MALPPLGTIVLASVGPGSILEPDGPVELLGSEAVVVIEVQMWQNII
jgi:hypothetical protein